MFGIIRPCQHRLSPELRTSWLAHLCGMCLALRDDHGQFARMATNYDGLVISVLVEAQSPAGAARRSAGPCPLRGMRGAEVSLGDGARLAGAVSLVLASAKVSDHVVDGDGAFGRRPVAGIARRVADRWARQGALAGGRIGFDTAVLLDAVHRQGTVEAGLGPGDSVLLATEPTESATAAAFAHTAELATLPPAVRERNATALAEAGRLFGRVAHLLDAVEDLEEDRLAGAWNPLLATGTDLEQARRLCDDAVLGVRLALREVEFVDGKLAHALLVHELRHAVARTFGDPHGHGHGHQQPPGQPPYWQRPAPPLPPGPGQPHPGRPYPGQPYPGQPYPGQQYPGQPYPGPQPGQPQQGRPHQGPPPPPPGQPGSDGPDGPPPPRKPRPSDKPQDGDGGWCWVPKFRVPPRKRNFVFGCLVATYMCCSCQVCCRDPWPGPWSGKPREACCNNCDCGPNCDCDCCGCDCC